VLVKRFSDFITKAENTPLTDVKGHVFPITLDKFPEIVENNNIIILIYNLCFIYVTLKTENYYIISHYIYFFVQKGKGAL